ncbi:MAG: DUF4926 domain-containing protein [Chitinophagaceae bacterium]
MVKLKEYDSVALLENLPENNLKKGQVGVVVMVYDNKNVEVEFLDSFGHTLSVCPLQTNKLLRLQYEVTTV